MKKLNTETNTSRKSDREQFLPYLDKSVHCTGEFAGVNIHSNENNKCITILFHNVMLNGEIPCDHVWVFYNSNFRCLNLKFGCVLEFDAVVQKYKHEERFGIGDCSNIRMISEGIDGSNYMTTLKIGTIRYDNFYLQKKPQGGSIPAHIQFMKEYGIKAGTRVELIYDEEANKSNKKFDKIRLSMYINGQKIEKAEVYFDPDNKHGLIIGKYFIPVKEQCCRSLSLIYLMHMSRPKEFACA